MFFKRYTKLRAGDVLKIEYLNDTVYKINFLREAKTNSLLKAKAILRTKNISCNNVNDLKELTNEIKKYKFKKNERRPRFNDNVVDLRDMVQDGEILVMAKAGATVKFLIQTHLNHKYTVEWTENGRTYKNVLNSDAAFTKVTPATGISSKDNTFKYTIYRIYSPGTIKTFSLPWGDAGNNISWFVSKNIKFDHLKFNASDYMIGTWGMQNLEYVDVLNGGMNSFRANGCSNLKEVEADYLYVNENISLKYAFCDCRNLIKLPDNTILKANNFDSTFKNCYLLEELPEIDLSFSHWNDYAFYSCNSLKRFKNNTLKINKNSTCSYICSNCYSLLEIPNIIYTDDELSKGTNFSYGFSGCSAATKMPARLDLSYARNGVMRMFQNCTSIIDGPSEILLYDNASDNIYYSVDYMFDGCTNMRSITTVISSVNVNSSNSMFLNCSSLKKAPKCNFPNNTNCYAMYRNCSTLVIPPDTINYPKASSGSYMFSDCSLLQSSPTTINLPNALEIQNMFNKCYSMTTGPTTINIKRSMKNNNAFDGCLSLENFGEENTIVEFNEYANNDSMFLNCSSLKKVCKFKGGQNFTKMFYNAALEKIPYIETSAVCEFINTFASSSIKTLNFDNLKVPNLTKMQNTFNGCKIEGALTANFEEYFPNCITWEEVFKNTGITSVNVTFPKNARYLNKVFDSCIVLKTAVVNIPSEACVQLLFVGSKVLESISINGNFKLFYQFTNLEFSRVKSLTINAPNWKFIGDNNWKTDKFTMLEECNISTNINNQIFIKNNKRLTDMNLNLITDEDVKNSVLIALDGNALTDEALNKIMTNLPDFNSLSKEDDLFVAELRIGNNPGTRTCDPLIAVNKGWEVYTS